mgnify:CR=1 FL=1
MSIIQGHAKSSGVTAFYPKTIDQSLRLNDNDAAYLTRTPSSAGNRKTWTWSGWVKLGNLYMSLPTIFSADFGSQGFNLTTDFDTLRLYNYTSSYNLHLTSSLKIRDPSAWYHIVVAMDTTQATASDRVKVYLNGTQITNFATEIYPSQNFETQVNAAVAHNFSKYSGQAGNYFDGYLAEVHLTDGTAYDADTFGELKSGIWIPKDPSVTYGTNGFYLDFANSADIGNDVSGNNNDFTVNNLVASDVVPDSPTNNFATFNPIARSASTNLYEGNLRFNNPAASYRNVATTIRMMPNTGKWYWEVYVETASTSAGLVQGNPEMYRWLGGGYVLGYASTEYAKFNQYKVTNNSFSTLWGTTAGTGSIIGFEFDSDNGDLYTYLNGTIEESGTAMFTGLTSSEGYVPALSAYNSTQKINFGQDSTFAGAVTAGGNTDANGIGDFKYTVPTGAKALCTSNLPDPVIDPASDSTPGDHFNAVTYSGSGADGNAITVGFQPDWVWIKERSPNARAHCIYDSVRGALGEKCLHSNLTSVEGANHDLTELASFDADGFTVDRSDNGTVDLTNQSGSSYVAWNWKAGTSISGSTGGAGTSKSYTGSINTTSGFSIIAYEGNSTAGHTIPHHLDSAPEMVIVKNRSDTDNWAVYHKYVASDPATDYMSLSTASAAADDSRFWNDVDPSSSVVTLGTIDWLNFNGHNNIMYCFHSVDGFSSFGSYFGNANADGPFIYTGFRPKFVIVKRSAGPDQWSMWDDARDPQNPLDGELTAETSAVESTIRDLDFVSNGFKIREGTYTGTTNSNASRYIYMAFAEQPFKYSNAR